MERHNQCALFRTVRTGLPVVSAVNTRTRVDRVADPGIDDIVPVLNFATYPIDRLVDGLVLDFRQTHKRTGGCIKLPEDAVLANRVDALKGITNWYWECENRIPYPTNPNEWECVEIENLV